MKVILNKKTFLIFTSLVFVFFAFSAFASTEVSLNSNTQNIAEGDNFTVDLNISTAKTSINVVDGKIVFDADKLEVKNISTDNSILTIWTVPVTFDNSKGQINFVGGIANGFLGAQGQILRITFLAKKRGQAKIDFKDSFAVFANDGKGTQINPWLKPITLDISPKTGAVTSFPWQVVSLVGLILVVLFLIKFLIKKHAIFKK